MPFIKAVTLSEVGRSAEILSTKDLYKPERDSAAAQAVYIPALLYAAFTGEDAESFTVHFTVKDETTGDVLGAFDYPGRRADRFRKQMQAAQKAPLPHPTPQNKPHTKNGAAQVYHPCAAPFFLLFRLCKLAHFFVF